MSMCEDYPCCGHTDGLGCDWVSPNEVVPCNVCIDARKPNPYHNGWANSCPTIRERAIAEVIAGAKCEYYDENDPRSCDGEQANLMDGDTPVCFDCFEEGQIYSREMQEQYDDNN